MLYRSVSEISTNLYGFKWIGFTITIFTLDSYGITVILNYMKKANNKPTPEEIANMANDGKDISKYFTNKGTMKQPIRRVNVDFTEEMLHELDQIASELNVSRQAVIKMYLQQALDQHYLATNKVS